MFNWFNKLLKPKKLNGSNSIEVSEPWPEPEDTSVDIEVPEYTVTTSTDTDEMIVTLGGLQNVENVKYNPPWIEGDFRDTVKIEEGKVYEDPEEFQAVVKVSGDLVVSYIISDCMEVEGLNICSVDNFKRDMIDIEPGNFEDIKPLLRWSEDKTHLLEDSDLVELNDEILSVRRSNEALTSINESLVDRVSELKNAFTLFLDQFPGLKINSAERCLQYWVDKDKR